MFGALFAMLAMVFVWTIVLIAVIGIVAVGALMLGITSITIGTKVFGIKKVLVVVWQVIISIFVLVLIVGGIVGAIAFLFG